MKIRARTMGDKIALDCKPLFGDEYTVYVSWFNEQWWLPSGRPATRKMLDAIDRLAGVTLRKRARS